MLGSQAGAVDFIKVLNPVSCANTAAATSGYIDVRKYNHGEMLMLQHSGAITGTLDGKWQDATDSGGTGVADIAGATYAQVTTANQAGKVVLPAGSTRGFVRYVGTIATGPVVLGVSILAHPGSV